MYLARCYPFHKSVRREYTRLLARGGDTETKWWLVVGFAPTVIGYFNLGDKAKANPDFALLHLVGSHPDPRELSPPRDATPSIKKQYRVRCSSLTFARQTR